MKSDCFLSSVACLSSSSGMTIGVDQRNVSNRGCFLEIFHLVDYVIQTLAF